jgi:hypothetical protein
MVTAKHLPSSGIDDENMCRFSFLVHSAGVFDSQMNYLGNMKSPLWRYVFLGFMRGYPFDGALLSILCLCIGRLFCGGPGVLGIIQGLLMDWHR